MTTMTKQSFLAGLIVRANSEKNGEGNMDVLNVLKEVKETQDWKTNIAKVSSRKVPELIETILFLFGTTAEKDPEMKTDLQNKLKDALVAKVVNRIDQIQPEYCRTCKKDYYFDLTEVSTLRCLTCERGACQECSKEDEAAFNSLKMRNHGIYFLCYPCSEPVPTDGKREEKKLRKGKKKEIPPPQAPETEKDPTENEKAKGEQNEVPGGNKSIKVSSDEEDGEDYVVQSKAKKKMEKKKKREQHVKEK